MNIQILQENLLKALTRCGRIISQKSPLPIMQHVLFRADEEGLQIIATNTETTELVHAGAKVEKPGGICVVARTLTEYVASLPQETVHLVVKDASLHISSAGFSATIPGMSTSEFPPVAAQTTQKPTTIARGAMLLALESVLFAAATDEGRPILTGVNIQQTEDGALFAATDGYRLSVKREPGLRALGASMVVPARALGEVVKVGTEEKEDGPMGLSTLPDGQLAFVIVDTEIRTRTLDGEYPNFEKIIPKTHTTRLLLDTEKLRRAVKSAAIFARDNANIVRFHIENQTLTVSSNTPQVGENHVDVEAKIDGEGGDVAFNSRFLVEFLANYKEEELLFEMTGSLNPGAFKPVKDDSYTHIIMPVRVQS